MSLAHKSFRTAPGKARITIPGLFLLLVLLAGCGGTAPPPKTPPLQFTSINLGLPPAALSAPVVGPLPAATPMHVGITFKANQQLLTQLDHRKVQSGQTLNLETVANTLGIDGATYQKIKSFFGIDGATLKLSKLHTNLTVDARARTFARLLKAVHSRHSVSDCRPLAGSLVPGQVAHAYGFDQLWQQGLRGEGMTVNLIEWVGFNGHDIQNYLTVFIFKAI